MPSRYILLALCFLIIAAAPGCRKNTSELEKLPPATQTGARTFGCLINGVAFTPKGSPFGGPILSCAYQYIPGDGHNYQLSSKRKNGSMLTSVSIHTDSMEVAEGNTYKIGDFYKKGGLSARHSFSNSEARTRVEYLTTATTDGELRITKMDSVSRIVSGTFWFDAVSTSGEKVEVREGRFDLRYTL